MEMISTAPIDIFMWLIFINMLLNLAQVVEAVRMCIPHISLDFGSFHNNFYRLGKI